MTSTGCPKFVRASERKDLRSGSRFMVGFSAPLSSDTSTRPGGWLHDAEDDAAAAADLALVIVWSQSEPGRIGQTAFCAPDARSVLGRGAARPDDLGPRLAFIHDRPGPSPEPVPLASPGLSRAQLVLSAHDGELRIERVGKAILRVNGRSVEQATIGPSDVIEIDKELLLACVARAPAALRGGLAPDFAFGEPDDFGFVGEGSRTWVLRDAVAAAARRPAHVLVVGPSGSGKELIARAVHALSARAAAPFIARNAATLPAGIIDAELFGNAKNYPNPGMRERKGLIGEASGGTLFLDEIGELPESLQAHLLRVLDAGEYHRLGDDRPQRADIRMVAATNRGRAALKHDFAARFPTEVPVPGLDERSEDVPLLARFLLRRLASSDHAVERRFFDGGEPRVSPDLVMALMAHTWTGHVRELESLLLIAVSESDAHFVALTRGVRERVQTARREPPTAAEVEAALSEAGGNVSRAFRGLGLPSRDALNRLIRKHGIVVKR